MKLLSACLLSLFLLLILTSEGSGQTRCENASTLLDGISKQHVSPPAFDEVFTKRVLESFVKDLDPQDLYFSKSEAAKIISYPLKLGKQEINACDLTHFAVPVFQSQLTVFKSFLNTTLSHPLDYKVKEYYTYDLFHTSTSASANQPLNERRMRWLKHLTLMRMDHEADINKSDDLLAYESKARERVLSREVKNIDKILNTPKGLEEYVTKIFFRSLAKAFDPHTGFFTLVEMKDFESALSTQKLSWGFDLQEDEQGQATIGNIEPGGSAWNSNAIHEEDVLVTLRFDDGAPVDALDYSPGELNRMINHSDKNKVEVTIRRKDGTLDKIKLEKSESEAQENKVKSLILSGEKKVGYISLPAFYTDWSNPIARGCANDVAKELVKLKKENISGLILDLRFNGGGLVAEAIDLAGIFIDYGPLMILKPKDAPPSILKDISRGVAYSGPMVILINGFSASASEIVAGALQDYKRAVIVGTKSFGKSTSQLFFPMINKDTIGYAKVTTEKVYRISGKSHQREGIIPDIILPDFTDLFGYNERSYPNSLPADSLAKKVYFTPLASLPINALRTKSESRLVASEIFQQIEKDHDDFKPAFPLEITEFSNYASTTKTYKTSKDNRAFRAAATAFDKQELLVDSYAKEINDALLTEIEQSPYIDEAFKIISDLVNSSKK